MIASREGKITVVPWNFNEISCEALDRALEMTDQRLIRVVHVADPFVGPDNGVLYAAAEKRKRRELEHRFREQVADDERAKRLRLHVVYGFAGREIVKFAERNKAELIVMASRKRKAVSRLLFGSTTQQVTRLAGCEVLALNGRTVSPNVQPQSDRLWHAQVPS